MKLLRINRHELGKIQTNMRAIYLLRHWCGYYSLYGLRDDGFPRTYKNIGKVINMKIRSFRDTEKLLEQSMIMVGLLLHRITFEESLRPAERDDAQALLAAYKEGE